ncbi:MAG: hypothetical protein Tsb002_13470 [Wenzhouxiangellaceae bacterium]
MGSQRQPISKVDTAWLRMEQPSNLMMITGLIFFKSTLDFEALLGVIEKRFLAFRRFRQKAVVGTRNCYWLDDEDFDIRSHVRRTALPGAADLLELQELTSDLASTPLDQSKPLWQFHLVENFEGGPVLITRIHHCYADGIALIQVLLSLTDEQPDQYAQPNSRESWKSRKAAESNIFRRLMEPAKDGLDTVSHWAMKLFEESLHLVREPQLATDYAQIAGEIADELAGALLLPDDPDTCLRGRLGPRKRVAWAAPLDLSEVKSVTRVLRCTVNDLLISTMTGALRHYLLSRGEDVDDLEIRATIPVNLRPLEHAKELGNHFGLVYLPLPVGEGNPLARVYRVHQYMEELKSSRQAAVSLGLLAALGMGPAMLQKPMLEMMSRKATTVLTNVPGPRRALYLAGSEVSELMFWVPQTGNIGMGISILSYNGKVFCGLITDRRLVPDPKEIVDQFHEEFNQLLYTTLLLDDETLADECAAEQVLTGMIKGEVAQTSEEPAAILDEELEALEQGLLQATLSSAAAIVAHSAPQDEPASDQAATPAQRKIAKKKLAHKRLTAKKTASRSGAKKAAAKTAGNSSASSTGSATAGKSKASKKKTASRSVKKKAAKKKAAAKTAAGTKKTSKKKTGQRASKA